MNFSCAVIAKNEEKTLPLLIKSLKDFQERGGDIVVVDTGSSDRTVEVAKELGCDVYEVGERFVHTLDKKTADAINKKFIVKGEEPVVKEGDKTFDFAAARNYAMSLAKCDMVFSPDCDEVLNYFDIDTLERLINEGVTQIKHSYIFARDGFGNPETKFTRNRFFDRREMKLVNIMHEVPQGISKEVYVSDEVLQMEHFQNKETKRGSYLIGLGLDLFQNPNNDRNSHYFARELFYNQRYKSAIKEFKRHIAMNAWEGERSQSQLLIGDCYKFLGDEEKAIEAYHKSFQICAQRRAPFIRLCELYQKRQDYQRLACYAMAALQIKNKLYYMDLMSDYTYKPHEILYYALWYLNRKDEAKIHFDLAASYIPEYTKFLEDQKFFYPELLTK